MIEIFGIKSCDTCKKSLKAFQGKGINAQLIDIRENPLSKEIIEKWLNKFGDALVNTRSTTWRNMTETEKSDNSLHQLLANPTLMKRPIILDQESGQITLGWTKSQQEEWFC